MEEIKDVEVLVKESESMALQYQAYSVISNEGLVIADEDLSKVKSKIKEIEDLKKDKGI